MTQEQVIDLIATQDVDKIKTEFEKSSTVTDLEKIINQYDISKHDVMLPATRADKGIKDDNGNVTETVKVARIPIPYQKKIVLVATAFLGSPTIETVAADDNEASFGEILNKILDDNKFDYKFRNVVKTTKSEKQCAILCYTEELPTDSEYWEGYKMDSKFRIRMKVLSQGQGDSLYPIFDGTGDMVSFGRYYEVKGLVNGKEQKDLHFDIYTNDNIYICEKIEGSSWAINTYKNMIGKIPVIYFSQPLTDWEEVQALIDRLEVKTSNHADTNDYYDSPIVKAKGKVEGFSQKGESGKVLQMSETADVSYMTYDSLPESMKMEMDNLKGFIGEFSHTPTITFENMQKLGDPSGILIKMLFMDAHLKAYDSEEIFGEASQRLFNYLKSAVIVLDPSYKTSVKIKLTPKFNYFLPKNDVEEVNNLVNAYGAGIISLETALSLNPLVKDAVKELEKINAEAALKPKDVSDPANSGGGVADSLGKIPLALQQLSLAATRATEAGDEALASKLNKKMDELLSTI